MRRSPGLSSEAKVFRVVVLDTFRRGGAPVLSLSAWHSDPFAEPRERTNRAEETPA